MKRAARSLYRRVLAFFALQGCDAEAPQPTSFGAFLRHLALLFCISLVAASAVVFLGLFNVSAKLGHLPGMAWVLHTTYINSVETWSGDYTRPDLARLDLVQRGAGHFGNYCSSCHAAPGQKRSLVTHAMVPSPPHITEAVEKWDADELFWIVKHGVKMSGMPAWPSDVRDDDVWAVVAFLLRVKAGMARPEYLQLAFGEALEVAEMEGAAELDSLLEPAGEAFALCVRCHGIDGRGRGTGAAPRLDILDEVYIHASLKAYAGGWRHSGIMQPVAYSLSDEQMRALARYYAGQPAPALPQAVIADFADEATVARGRAIAIGGLPGQGVPACAACHGPWPEPRPEAYPELAGQYPGYILDQLHLWKDGVRGGTPLAHIMSTVAEQLTDDDMKAVALFYSTLAPAHERSSGTVSDTLPPPGEPAPE